MAVALIPPQATGDILLCKLFCYYNGQYALNALHFKISSMGAQGCSLEEINSHVFAVLEAQWKQVISNVAYVWGMSTERVWPGPSLAAQSTSAPAQGTGGTAAAAPQLSMYITTYAGPKGRKYRGRVYLPFMPDAFIDVGGSLAAAGIQACDDVGQLLDTAIAVTGANGTCSVVYGIYHKATKTFDEMMSWKHHTHIGTQVRRSFTRRDDQVPW